MRRAQRLIGRLRNKREPALAVGVRTHGAQVDQREAQPGVGLRLTTAPTAYEDTPPGVPAGSRRKQPASRPVRPSRVSGQGRPGKRRRPGPLLNNRPFPSLSLLLGLVLFAPVALAIAPIVPALLASAAIHGGVLMLDWSDSGTTKTANVSAQSSGSDFDNIGADTETVSVDVMTGKDGGTYDNWEEAAATYKGDYSCGDAHPNLQTYVKSTVPDDYRDVYYACFADGESYPEVTGIVQDKIKFYFSTEQREACPEYTVERDGTCVPVEVDLPQTENDIGVWVDPNNPGKGIKAATKSSSGGTTIEQKAPGEPVKQPVTEDTSGNPVENSQVLIEATGEGGGTFNVVEFQHDIDASGTDTARVTTFNENNEVVSQETYDSWTNPDWGKPAQWGEEWSSSAPPEGDSSTPLGDADSPDSTLEAADETTPMPDNDGDGVPETEDPNLETPDTPYSAPDSSGQTTGISDLEQGVGDVPGAPATDGLGNSFTGIGQVGSCQPAEATVWGKTYQLDYCTTASYIRTVLAWVFALLTAVSIYGDWFRRPS